MGLSARASRRWAKYVIISCAPQQGQGLDAPSSSLGPTSRMEPRLTDEDIWRSSSALYENARWPWAENAQPHDPPLTFDEACNESWFQEATDVSYGTCPQCDRKSDICYCDTCGPGFLFCRECVFDHRESEHAYEPSQADSEPLTNKDYAQDKEGKWSRASEDLPKELV